MRFPLQPDQAYKGPYDRNCDQFIHEEVVLIARKEKQKNQQNSPCDNGDGTGTFNWATDSSDAGTFQNIIFTATDGGPVLRPSPS
mgnify:CR=1 FL=1